MMDYDYNNDSELFGNEIEQPRLMWKATALRDFETENVRAVEVNINGDQQRGASITVWKLHPKDDEFRSHLNWPGWHLYTDEEGTYSYRCDPTEDEYLEQVLELIELDKIPDALRSRTTSMPDKRTSIEGAMHLPRGEEEFYKASVMIALSKVLWAERAKA